MDLTGDRRGQSIQIGAIILFGTLIILLSTYQAFVVPDQNRGVEFSHSQTVQNDMQDVRNTLVSMPDGGESRSVSVELGTRYPDRAVFVNPGPPSGSLRTIGTEDPAINVSLANAAATGDAGDFWDGDPVNYSSGVLIYKPNYNVYDNPPTTVYDNTVLYNEFRSGNTTIARQNLIDGDRINLIALNGSLSESRLGAVSLDIQAASSSRNSVQITNSSNDKLTISIPTRISVERWKELLDAESVDNGGNVDVQNITSESLSGEFRLLTIPLEENDYILRAARAGTGSNVGERDPAYLVTTSGDGTTVTEGQSTTLEVEVRDEFNNPVSSVQVNATAESGSVDSEETTDEDGRATFAYTAPTGTSGETSVNASFKSTPGSDFNESTPENVTFDLTIQQSGSGNGSASSYNIDWTRPPFSTQTVSQTLNESDQPDVQNSIAGGTLLEARTTDGGDPVAQADIDYGVGSPSNATFTPSEGETDADGRNETNLVRHQDGVTKIYAASGGASDKTTVTADRLLYESFEADENALVSNGWYYNTSNGEGDAGIKTSGAVAGSRVAYINGNGGSSAGDRAIELNYTLDTSNYDSLTLSYVAIEPGGSGDDADTPDSGADWVSGENLRVQYKASDGSWVTIDNVSSQNDGDWYQYRRVTLDGVDNASHNGFDLRFRQGETTADDEWQIDAIDLVGVNESVESDLNQAPQAHFRVESQNGLDITVDANRSDDPDGNISSYEWDFGDGETGTGEENSTSYSSAGTYDVTLTVTDEGGKSATRNQTVTVGSASATFFDVTIDDTNSPSVS
ncbi:MAG: PKD domain-containing protein [Haloarculaceae archaeon]